MINAGEWRMHGSTANRKARSIEKRKFIHLKLNYNNLSTRSHTRTEKKTPSDIRPLLTGSSSSSISRSNFKIVPMAKHDWKWKITHKGGENPPFFVNHPCPMIPSNRKKKTSKRGKKNETVIKLNSQSQRSEQHLVGRRTERHPLPTHTDTQKHKHLLAFVSFFECFCKYRSLSCKLPELICKELKSTWWVFS